MGQEQAMTVNWSTAGPWTTALGARRRAAIGDRATPAMTTTGRSQGGIV